MNLPKLRIELKPSTLIPIALVFLALGILIYAFLGHNFKTTHYRGLAAAGSYYRILPDFTCAGRRKVQSSITIDKSGFKTKTTNPLDCSEVESFLAPEDEIDVGYDRAHLGFGDAIFEKMPNEPNLMESLPAAAELWCRPQSEQAPPLDVYAVQTLEGATVSIQRAEKLEDGTFRVHMPVTTPATRKFVAGRLSFETEKLALEAQTTSNAGNGKISGHLKAQLAGAAVGALSDQFVDMNIVCRTSLRHGFLCPIGYVQVPPLKNYLAQDVCISRVEVSTVPDKTQALTTCRAFGRGFDLARTEEWTAALKAVNHVGWNSGGAREWTKDGVTESASPMGFRCVFHPKEEGEETILPLAYEPKGKETDELPVEVGIRFKSSTQALAKGVRFYRTSVDASGYTVHLWSSTGQALATATGSGAGAPGWQVVPFAEPVVLEAGKTYTASYYAASGRVPFEPEGLKFEMSRGLSLSSFAGGGVLISNGGFPSQSSTNNYGVDVVVEPAGTVPSAQ